MYDTRDQIPKSCKWDLTELFPDSDSFEKAFSKLKEQIAAFPAHQKDLTSAGGLLLCIKDYFDIRRQLSKLYEFAARQSDLDLSDNAHQAVAARVRMLYNDLSSACYFLTPAVIRIPQKRMDAWYKEQPELESYRRFIDGCRRYKPHTLDEKSEKLLADLSFCMDTHETVRSVFADADLTFGTIRDAEGTRVPLTDTNYVPFLMSSDRKVRQAAFRTLYKTYGQYGNTFSGLLDGFVKEKIALAKVRAFGNSLEASVFDDEVPSAIYNNLVQTVRTNLDPLFRYYALKKRMLGLSALHLYDIYAPLITSQSRPYPYEEAVELVLKALRPLGKDYVDTLRRGLTKEGWVDVYPSKGKRGGASSSGCYDSKPYILLNYQDRFDDVSTLAHEAGHSMHSYYSRTANLPQNSEYTIFVAEVASTVNELLLSNYMLKNCTDRDMKLNLLDERMNTFKGTLYRQTMFAEFEQLIHRKAEAGEPLTKDALCEAYYELNRHYFGKDVVCDKQIACEWMRIPHFYYNFYVYKYATCISAASAIVKRIETEGESYVQKYLAFLSCGDSRSPLESLKVAGIDMTEPDVILAAIEDFSDAVEQFEKEVSHV